MIKHPMFIMEKINNKKLLKHYNVPIAFLNMYFLTKNIIFYGNTIDSRKKL